jgi:hypothetical protein
MNTDTNPVIAVISDTGAWAVMPLENLLALDDGIDADALRAALGVGETFVEGGGAAPAVYIASLSHRDTPHHLPGHSVACHVYAAFCFFFGLDGEVDAHENLIRVIGENPGYAPSSLIINWLRAFVDVFDELEG